MAAAAAVAGVELPHTAGAAIVWGVLAGGCVVLAAMLLARARLSRDRHVVRLAAPVPVGLLASGFAVLLRDSSAALLWNSALILAAMVTAHPAALAGLRWRSGLTRTMAAAGGLGVAVLAFYIAAQYSPVNGPSAGAVRAGAAAIGMVTVVLLAAIDTLARRRGDDVLRGAVLSLLLAAAAATISPLVEAPEGAFAAAPVLLLVAAVVAALAVGAVDIAGTVVESQRRLFGLMLRAAQQELELDAERTFGATRRHDQRSALVAIEGALEVLTTRTADLAPRDREQLTGAMRAELARLRRGLTRGRDNDRSVVALKQLVSPMVTCMRAEGADVRLDIAASLELCVDGDALLEILQNVVDNAVDHGSNAKIRVSAENVGADVLIAVEDSGPGVPKALRDVIFERGVTSKTSTHSGLGLFAAGQCAASSRAPSR